MIDKKELLVLVNKYFAAFEAKDIEALSGMFSDHIILFDPYVKEVKGKENVLIINQNIFSDCKTIKFTRKKIIIDAFSNTAAGEVEFFCNSKVINVTDILDFDEDGKIRKITAYLDRSD